MKLIRGAVKTGIAMKALDVARREMRKPENQAKAKAMLARAQQEFRKPENQRKAKELLGKVSKRGGGTSSTGGTATTQPTLGS